MRPIVEQLSLGEEQLRASGGRVDWDVWVDFIELVEQHLGHGGAMEMMAAAANTVRLHQFQSVAQWLSSPVALYQLNSRWGVPNQHRHMRSTCEPLPNGQLRVRLSIPTSYRGSIPVFQASLGVVRGLPVLIGLPESKVIDAEVTPHSLSVVLEPPRSRTLLSRAARLGHKLGGLGSVLTQLGEQELELDEKRATLERQLEAQKRVEAALRVSEERWRALAENAPGIILILADDGRLLSASRAFLGLEPRALVGRDFAQLLEPGDRPHFTDARLRALSQRELVDLRFRVVSGTHETWYAARFAPLSTGDARPTLCAFLSDISEQLRAERDLRAREEELQRAQRLEALGRLAGGVAHDFNNLLTVIRGSAELLLDEPNLDAEQREEVEQIDKASERAAGLTRQLLAFSRQQVISPEPLLLDEVIEQARPMLERMVGEDILLELSAPPRLPHVRLDRSQVDQVLMNLAVNARDAMPRGGSLRFSLETTTITEDTASEHKLRGGTYVQLSVRDSGLGMSREVAAHVFEPFYSTKQRNTGTGLGLAIVRGIAAQSGGDVSVESELGHGSCFRLRFPVCEPAAADEHASNVAPPARHGAGETVLVVEDDAQVRSLVTKVLRLGGYRVLESSGGAEALAIAKRERVDLLLSDVVMPEISGPELARLLCDAHPDVLVLFMSGYAEHEIAHRGIVSPHVSLLSKPFNSEALLQRVRARLDERHQQERKSS
ncbi:MAG: response regulator [Polyangiaceae bacterium]